MLMRQIFLAESVRSPNVIQWQPARPGSIERGEDTIVWVDIAKLDAAWRRDIENYIGPGGTGAIIGRRYPAFGEWLPTRQEKVRTPEVYIVPESGRPSMRGAVTFGNGRH